MSLHGQEYIVPSAINEFGKKYQVPAILIFVDVPRVMGQTLMDKAHGGPYDNPFQHACEAETSLSMALFPEMVKLEDAEDNTPWGFCRQGTSIAAETFMAIRFLATVQLVVAALSV